jgi:hypothetical protein
VFIAEWKEREREREKRNGRKEGKKEINLGFLLAKIANLRI